MIKSVHKNNFILTTHTTLSCFVDFIQYPTGKYMFKVNNEKIRLICWMCSKLTINTAWNCSSACIVDFGHSQHIKIVFLFSTLSKYLSAGYERQVIMFWKHKKRYICFVTKVARPISFSDISWIFQWIPMNYEHMTMF